MIHFPKIDGLVPNTTGSQALTPDMLQALSLVRSGKLQEASDLLLGAGAVADSAASGNAHFSDVLSRGMANAKEMLGQWELPGATAFTPPATSAAGTASPTRRSAASGGRNAAEAPGRFESVAFQHGHADHPYFLYTPAAPAPATGRPLILMLHGCTQDAQDFAKGTRMNAVAESAGALVLYPTQERSANANGCWNWFRPQDQQAGAGEPALLLAMVQHAIAAHGVDKQRVYVAGLSAGGAMAAVLAQEYPDVFAAVGVHSGLAAGAANSMMGALSAMKSGAKGWTADTAGAKPVPMIVFHGDADATVHPQNGEQLLQGAVAGAATSVQTQDAGTSADGQRYIHTCVVDASDAASSGEVLAEHWLLSGAGHAWSGGSTQGSYATAGGVNASAEMLRFFLSHTAQPGAARGA